VTAEKLFVLGLKGNKAERIFYNQHNFPTLSGTAWLYRDKWFDVVTGRQVSQLPGGVKPDCAVMAGHYLIGLNDEAGPHGRKRDDNMALVRFTVVDMTDPAKPKLVSDRNYLGYKEPPADIIVQTYFKDFDPYAFAGCYRGTPSYVTEHMSGPVPHGNRLLVQTSAFLYCIGENAEGADGTFTLGDRLTTVQLDGSTLRGKVSLRGAWYELDCSVKDDAITGTYTGNNGAQDVNRAVACRDAGGGSRSR
jgi:hypothetical protein